MYCYTNIFVFTKNNVFLQKQVTNYTNIKFKTFLKMPIKLTQSIKDKIKDDKKLFVEITEVLDIKLTSLYALINRDAPILCRYDVAKKIAEYLNIPIDEVFEQEELVS